MNSLSDLSMNVVENVYEMSDLASGRHAQGV